MIRGLALGALALAPLAFGVALPAAAQTPATLRIGLADLQMAMSDAAARLMDWLPIPLQELEPCIPSRQARRKPTRAWFSKVELPKRLQSASDHTPLLAVT